MREAHRAPLDPHPRHHSLPKPLRVRADLPPDGTPMSPSPIRRLSSALLPRPSLPSRADPRRGGPAATGPPFPFQLWSGCCPPCPLACPNTAAVVRPAPSPVSHPPGPNEAAVVYSAPCPSQCVPAHNPAAAVVRPCSRRANSPTPNPTTPHTYSQSLPPWRDSALSMRTIG